jgi:hypothetical protein
MKNKPQEERDWHERRMKEERKKRAAPPPPPATKDAAGRSAKGAPESPQSRQTFPKRSRKPGAAGLANEARPGLGTRADEADPNAGPGEIPKEAKSQSKPKATPHAYEEPRPEPREQRPDSLAHEQERSTGVSGHTGNT